ncbi:MAG: tyrosine-type recombinase/integrase, partial [Planctomycetota bacterium]
MGSLYRRSDAGEKGNKIWQAQYTDHTGKVRRRSTRTRSKKVAQQILNGWEAEEAQRRSGLIDPADERRADEARRPIDEHLDDFIASLAAKGGNAKHRNRTRRCIESIIAESNWQSIREITAGDVEAYAAAMFAAGRSNQTVAHYIQAIKQFSRWLSRRGKIQSHVLDSITKPNPAKDRRRVRRMLHPDEWPWLRDASESRAIVYELAIQTGLRASEIRSLSSGRIKAAETPPHVIVASGDTKNADMARQYVTPDLAAALADHAPASKTRLFDLPSLYEMADMIRSDLGAARQAYLDASLSSSERQQREKSDFLLAENHDGERIDFHALRHTCGAWLAMRGVHPKTIQTIMRHKTITLTMDTYGHLFPD